MTEARAQRRAERLRLAAEQAIRDAAPSTGNRVVDAARRHFVRFQRSNCGFVHAIAKDFGVGEGMWGSADDQIATMRRLWRRVSRDESIVYAARGELVVAGLRGDEHTMPRCAGHVAVVTPGESYRNMYPTVWSGSLGGIAGQSRGDRSVGQIWRIDDRDRVTYFASPIQHMG